MVQGPGFRVQGSGFRVLGFGVWFWGKGFIVKRRLMVVNE
jgi:hypothetical protein